MQLLRLALGWLAGSAVVFLPMHASAADEPGASATPPPTVETRRRRPAYSAVEVHGLITGEMVPKPFFGLDAAYAIGTENFFLRAGGGFMGAPAFRLAQTVVANTMQYGLLDVCAGKSVQVHRIRMCIGGEAGAWRHIWKSSQRPTRDWTPHIAGTLKADYTYQVGEHLGVVLGVGVSIPVIGPSFQGRDQYDRPSPLVIPGPVAGTLRLGALYRFG
jgi:hypothetical protein